MYSPDRTPIHSELRKRTICKPLTIPNPKIQLEILTRILTRESNSKIHLENPTRNLNTNSNSRIQLENPSRNPNSNANTKIQLES